MHVEGMELAWIVVKDLTSALEFYTKVAGLKLEEHHAEYGWAELSAPSGARLGIAQEQSEMPNKAGSNAIVTISVKNLEHAKAHFVSLGATLIGDTIEVPGHIKMQSFADKDGNEMQLVQKTGN